MSVNGGSVEVQNLPVNKIKISKNSRMSVSPDELDGLMQSIKETGLLQPIGVVKSGGGYEICYGNRRYLAVTKLGLSRIPAIVHEKKREHDIDIKNLTENVQRRNVSMAEVGRYLELLKDGGLSNAEAAVRLGVTKGYVENCVRAYQEVPTQFRDDLEIQVGKHNDRKRIPGKIAISTANKIANARRHHRLSHADTVKLFKAAKSNDNFSAENIDKYAVAIKQGIPDFVESVEPIHRVCVNFYIAESEKEKLTVKYITGGPFKSIPQLCAAILRGEKAVKIDILKY